MDILDHCRLAATTGCNDVLSAFNWLIIALFGRGVDNFFHHVDYRKDIFYSKVE
jgi:hypothetical protein